MDSLESKLGEILSSPEKMEQVMKIAGELLGSSSQSEPPKVEPSAPTGGFGEVLGGLDPRFMSAAMQVLGALGRDDDSTRLLRALRPHLRAERCERLDRAVQILRISGAIRAAIHSFSGGAGDVQQI